MRSGAAFLCVAVFSLCMVLLSHLHLPFFTFVLLALAQCPVLSCEGHCKFDLTFDLSSVSSGESWPGQARQKAITGP